MDAIEKDKQLQRLKYLITTTKTGTAEEIAREIAVSRSTLFRLINHLKIREQQNIKFCKKRNCYHFTDDE